MYGTSDRLELLERLPTRSAPADRLARRRAELASDLGVSRVAVRALWSAGGAEELHEVRAAARAWGRDAIGLELRARVGGDPIRRPRGCVDRPDAHVGDAARLE